MSAVPAQIFRKQDGRMRFLGWVMLAILAVTFVAFSILGERQSGFDAVLKVDTADD